MVVESELPTNPNVLPMQFHRPMLLPLLVVDVVVPLVVAMLDLEQMETFELVPEHWCSIDWVAILCLKKWQVLNCHWSIGRIDLVLVLDVLMAR